MIPGHAVHETIKEVDGLRRILRTRVDGADAVTRILLATTVPAAREGLVKGAVLHGYGSLNGIDARLADTLEGYRVAARLPHPDPRWPTALAAGVLPAGHVYITTRWMPGTPLHRLPDGLPYAQRTRIAVDVATLLAELHARRVVFGDLKAANLVLGQDGQVCVIDLDTLREVVNATTPVITTDATPAWAAPEQNERHESYLASDLWAWANLLRTLFPEGPPDAWRFAVAACRARDPARRPTAASLVAHLADTSQPLLDASHALIDLTQASSSETAGQSTGADATDRVAETPGGATERVSEAIGGATVRVQDDGEPLPEPTGARVARSERSSVKLPGCLGLLAILGASAIALCVGPIAYWDHGRVAEANRLADEALAAWKEHKIRVELNGRSRRADLLAMAEAAYEVRETPHASSVRALATVWAQGWQDSGRDWSDVKWTEAEAAVEAAGGRGEPEALLAEAVLYGARCRMRDTEPTVGATCDRARDALKRFHAALPEGAEHHWIRVEAAWTEVLILGDLAHREAKAGLPTAATTRADAFAMCDASAEWRAWAPVNGPELVQDCLRIAGAAHDVQRYLRYAKELVAGDLARNDEALRTPTLEHLYTAWDGCGGTTVRRGRKGADWVVKGDDWCTALGATARGCSAVANATIGRLDEPDRPWAALQPHLVVPGVAGCAK